MCKSISVFIHTCWWGHHISSYFWCEEELESLGRSFQGQSSDEEDGEDQIGQSGSDVNSLENDGTVKSVGDEFKQM